MSDRKHLIVGGPMDGQLTTFVGHVMFCRIPPGIKPLSEALDSGEPDPKVFGRYEFDGLVWEWKG